MKDEILSQEDEMFFNKRLREEVYTLITPIQHRRFKMYASEGFTYREIAYLENVDVKEIWDSVELSKKFKNF